MNALKDTLSAFKQLTKSQNDWGGIDLSLDYQHTFKKPQQLLTLSYKPKLDTEQTDNTSEVTEMAPIIQATSSTFYMMPTVIVSYFERIIQNHLVKLLPLIIGEVYFTAKQQHQ